MAKLRNAAPPVAEPRAPRGAAAAARWRHAVLVGGLAALVALGVLAVHAPVRSAQALHFDDLEYFHQNPLVRNPCWSSAGRFFAEVFEPSSVRGYYQPLAMLSLMGDAALGARPGDLGVVRATSLVLHIVNSVLLFLLLNSLFGNPLLAAVAALLCGVHPLTVEPVAWLAERKTLLAMLFALLCLLAYVRHAWHGGRVAYGVALAAFALSLLSKPAALPLPLVLVLLDWWPLQRLDRRALLEKVPYAVLALAAGVVALLSQGRTVGVVILPAHYSPWQMPLSVLYNVAFYPGKILVPWYLSGFYPFPVPFTFGQPWVLAGAVLLVALLAGGAFVLRRAPAVGVGVLAFYLLLAPTLGVVTFANAIASDRHAYVPLIGVAIALAGGGLVLWTRAPRWRGALLSVAVLLVLGAGVRTRLYLREWRDTETLYRHMLAGAPDAAQLHRFLGVTLEGTGRMDEALAELARAVELDPQDAIARHNLGSVLANVGRPADALPQLEEAVRLAPNGAESHANLGRVLTQLQRPAEAEAAFREALRLAPNSADARKAYAIHLATAGRLPEAEEQFRLALSLAPQQVELLIGYARVLAAQNKVPAAIETLERARAIAPRDPRVQADLAQLRRGRR